MEQAMIKLWNCISFWCRCSDTVFDKKNDDTKYIKNNSITLKSMICKNCGAGLVKDDQQFYKCEYCGTRYLMNK